MRLSFCLLAIALVRVAAAQTPATITIGSGQADMQGNASIDVTFKSNQAVAALQFDIESPPQITAITATSGTSTTISGKTLYTATVLTGVIRVLIAGLNINAISDGPITILFLHTKTGVAAGIYPLAIRNTFGASPDGSSVSVTGSDGSLVLVVSGPGLQAPIVTAVANAASFALAPSAPNTLMAAFGNFPGCTSDTQVFIN
jgi:hypothetical protein